jgi:hypothetical protein
MSRNTVTPPEPPRCLHVLDTKSCCIRQVEVKSAGKVAHFGCGVSDRGRLHLELGHSRRRRSLAGTRSLMNAIKILGIDCTGLSVRSGCPGRMCLPKRKPPLAISRCSDLRIVHNPTIPTRLCDVDNLGSKPYFPGPRLNFAIART